MMASFMKTMPSASTLLSAFASTSTLFMLIRTIVNDLLPLSLRYFISKKFHQYCSNWFSCNVTFIIEDRWKAVDNVTFRAAEVYLPTRAGHSANVLTLGNNDNNNTNAPPKLGIAPDSDTSRGGTVVDEFEGVKVEWTLYHKEASGNYHHARDKRYFHLTCKKSDRDIVVNKYLPHVSKTAEEILNKRDTLNIYTYQDCYWQSTAFNHPATFDTIAMEPALKQSIIDDLDAFVVGKDFYSSVGRAWKRGYLLYGPPGTGKSSLVAAIANYMRYNIYDLQLQSVSNDADLRDLLTSTTSRSILLIEDIDCSLKASSVKERGVVKVKEDENEAIRTSSGVTLSGLLNFIDGIWLSCVNERIIILTTNYKEKLDQALLRPGRMDVHIHMGYCTPMAFKKLASSYLKIKEHANIGHIESLIQRVNVTPSEVAEQLMINCTNPEIALENLINFLNKKESGIKQNETEKEEAEKVTMVE